MRGRAGSGGALGLAIVAAMLMVFVAFLLSVPLFWMAWDEDACVGHGPPGERVTATQSNSLWPPGTECRFEARGETTERFVDAGSWDPLKWPVLVLLAAAPLTLAAGLFASIHDLRASTGREGARARNLDSRRTGSAI